MEEHQRFQTELSQIQQQIRAKDEVILRLTSQLREVSHTIGIEDIHAILR